MRADLNRLLSGDYGITPTTIQFECVGCDPNHLYCDLRPEGGPEHDHVAVETSRPSDSGL